MQEVVNRGMRRHLHVKERIPKVQSFLFLFSIKLS
jgi:hypothetical protein